jgi:excisionase family DNA binding protein
MSIMSTGRSDPERAHDEGALVVRPRQAFRLLDCGSAKGYELINSGELPSYKEGRARKIPVWAIREYIKRRVAAEAQVRAERARDDAKVPA